MSKRRWTALEDFRLIEAVNKHSDKWSIIASGFSGRSVTDCIERASAIHQAKPHAFNDSPHVKTKLETALMTGANANKTAKVVPKRKYNTVKNPIPIPLPVPATHAPRKMIPMPKRSAALVPILQQSMVESMLSDNEILSSPTLQPLVNQTSTSIASPCDIPITDNMPSNADFEELLSSRYSYHQSGKRSRYNILYH